jgi:hypothetical protein
LIQFTRPNTGLNPDRRGECVKFYPLHLGQIYDESVITGAISCEAMAATSHRYDKFLLSCKFDRTKHVLFGRAHCDQRRSGIELVIPDAASRIVSRIARGKDVTR